MFVAVIRDLEMGIRSKEQMADVRAVRAVDDRTTQYCTGSRTANGNPGVGQNRDAL
jgi:hypothetical protein